jgi:hypothetical protein
MPSLGIVQYLSIVVIAWWTIAECSDHIAYLLSLWLHDVRQHGSVFA